MTTQSADSISHSIPPGIHRVNAVPSEVLEMAQRSNVAQYLPQVIDLVREIYGDYSEVSVSIDPEISDGSQIVFHIPVNCSVEEALELDLAWARRLRRIIPHCPRVYVPSLEFVT